MVQYQKHLKRKHGEVLSATRMERVESLHAASNKLEREAVCVADLDEAGCKWFTGTPVRTASSIQTVSSPAESKG